jgi:hypothetical protein
MSTDAEHWVLSVLRGPRIFPTTLDELQAKSIPWYRFTLYVGMTKVFAVTMKGEVLDRPSRLLRLRKSE